MPKPEGEGKKTTNEKPISLYPLTTDEALKALLQVKPPPKKEKKKRNNDKSAKQK